MRVDEGVVCTRTETAEPAGKEAEMLVVVELDTASVGRRRVEVGGELERNVGWQPRKAADISI